MRNYRLTIISAILILIAVLMPGQNVPQVGVPGIDKIIHFSMFGVLTLCFYFEYSRHQKKLPRFFNTVLMIGAFGLLTEVMQLFTDSRSFDMRDLAVDLAGILIVSSVFKFYQKKS
jgi:VanZ family protein